MQFVNSKKILFVGFCLLATVFSSFGCNTFKQRMAWTRAALKADADDEKKPSPSDIDDFFDIETPVDHPYFKVDFQKELDERTNSHLSTQNDLTLLPNRSSLQAKLNLIAAAKQSVYVATFHLICDKGGLEFTRALIAAAERGIDVRFLATGGPWEWWFSGKCPDMMSKANVKVAHTPYSYLTNKGVVQLHDKILVVDGHQVVVGGQNIGSWYSESNGVDRNFRDTDVLVEGPVVNTIGRRFAALWGMAKPEDQSLQTYLSQLAKQDENARRRGILGTGFYRKWLKPGERSGLCRFVAQDPHQNTYHVFDAYKLYADNARRRIAFHTPSLNALGSEKQESLWHSIAEVANKPDGRVFVLTNGPGFVTSDMMNPSLGRIVGYYLLGDLFRSTLNKPVDIFAYRSWLHSKVYYFDGIAVGIGSFNFDDSGLVWTENTLICIDPSLVKQATEMLKNDFSHSIKLERPLLKEDANGATETAPVEMGNVLLK